MTVDIRVPYTLRGMSFLLHWIAYSPQVPVHRAVERDKAASPSSGR
jgi:winged helix-turn-helix protein